MGFGEGRNLLLGKRNPSSNPSRAHARRPRSSPTTPTYGTRQSNKKDGDGGGAIYGCRSTPGQRACIRSNNLNGGRAFEFATAGNEAGRIETGNPTGAPFTTNATGVATGLNADQVDGKDATDFASRRRRSTFATVAGSLLAVGRRPSPAAHADRRHAATTRHRQRLHGHVQQGREQVLLHGVAAGLRAAGPGRRARHRTVEPGHGEPCNDGRRPAPAAARSLHGLQARSAERPREDDGGEISPDAPRPQVRSPVRAGRAEPASSGCCSAARRTAATPA